MSENSMSEIIMFKNGMFQNKMFENLDVKDAIKSLLAFLVVYKEVFAETNQPIKNYIQMVSQNSQTGGGENQLAIQPASQPGKNDISPFFNALGDTPETTSLFDDLNYLPVLKKIALASVDITQKLISASIDVTKNITENMTQTIGKNCKKGFSRKAIKYAAIVIITVLILSEEQIKNTPTNQIAAVVKQKVKMYSEYLNILTNDPNHMAVISEFSVVVASALNKVIDLIEPQVSEIIQKLEKLLENASHDIARGVTHTGLGLAKAFIAEAPVVGGLIDFVITGAEAFTSSSKIAKSLVNDGGAIVDNFTQIFSEFRKLSDQKKGEFSGALNNFNKLPAMDTIQAGRHADTIHRPSALTETTMGDTSRGDTYMGMSNNELLIPMAASATKIKNTSIKTSNKKRLKPIATSATEIKNTSIKTSNNKLPGQMAASAAKMGTSNNEMPRQMTASGAGGGRVGSTTYLVKPNDMQEPTGGGKKMSNKSIIKKYNKIQKNIIKTSKRISETLKKFKNNKNNKNNKKNKTRRNK